MTAPVSDYRGRYAPSPSGDLHLGNARTALLAWLRARRQGGALVMRIDDLDGPRTVEAAVLGNLEELAWLGLDWDEGPDVGGAHGPYRQSMREAFYAAALERLTSARRTFDCYLSRRELRDIGSAPHGTAPVYGPAQRRANDRVRAARREAGRTPSVRLRAEPGRVEFEDLLAGPQSFEVGRDLGDTVVRRADGQWAYQLATVVDDDAMGITEVVRGDDLLPSTATQLLLYDALALRAPAYAHVPLLLDQDGTRLSKRRGSLTLRSLRARGVEPERVVGLLAFGLGLLPDLRPVRPVELATTFALADVATGAAQLTPDQLAWLHGDG